MRVDLRQPARSGGIRRPHSVERPGHPEGLPRRLNSSRDTPEQTSPTLLSRPGQDRLKRLATGIEAILRRPYPEHHRLITVLLGTRCSRIPADTQLDAHAAYQLA